MISQGDCISEWCSRCLLISKLLQLDIYLRKRFELKPVPPCSNFETYISDGRSIYTIEDFWRKRLFPSAPNTLFNSVRRCLGTQNPFPNHLQKGLEHQAFIILCFTLFLSNGHRLEAKHLRWVCHLWLCCSCRGKVSKNSFRDSMRDRRYKREGIVY